MTWAGRLIGEVGSGAWLLWRAAIGAVLDLAEADPFAADRLGRAIRAVVWAPLATLAALSGLTGLLVGISAGRLLKVYQVDLVLVPGMAGLLVREIGPMVVGVFAASRVSVLLAARIAEMRQAREIEALELLGLDPARYVLSPVLVAVLLAVPIHTMVAASVSLAAAGLALQSGALAPWGRYLSLVLTQPIAWAALIGLAKVLAYFMLTSAVGAAVGTGASTPEAGLSARPVSAFTLGLLAVFATAALWAALSR
jgi:phospholipid/cholesterol/gamma-HCH transport system permease protein